MTDTNTQSSTGKAPSHIAYQVKDRGDDRPSIWTRIGAAWSHNDGKGFSVQLESVPLDGRISLRVVEDRKDQ